MDGIAGGYTLLHLALDGDPEILKTLLEFRKRFDINALSSDGVTALHGSIKRSDIRYLQILIRAGADLNTPDPNGETALHIAARKAETLDHLKLLLTQSDIDSDKICSKLGSPLCIASRKLNVEGVRALVDRGVNVNLSIPNNLLSTPLISVLGTYGCTTRSKDILTIDVITRILVFKEADVKQTVPGGRFYTALTAACLSAGPATLKFLIEEGAKVDLADTVSGRLPHHFAAANGLDNFQAIMLSYRGDMMVSDNQQKNCLHWAAQFGNLGVVEFIISRLNDEGKLARYINRPDSDGWTPLCWASRPCKGGWVKNMRSEQPNSEGVVKALLLNGAQRDVKCSLGNGTDTEELTPLDLARRCDAGEDIIAMLQHGVGDQSDFEAGSGMIAEGPVRIYALYENLFCDICFHVSFPYNNPTPFSIAPPTTQQA
jgi:ankyrin repeat protein